MQRMARLETEQTNNPALEQEKVRDLLRAAMIRQGDLEDRGSPELELQEALAIGEELNIPAEQVQAAYAEQHAKEVRGQRRKTLLASLQRRQRRTGAMLGGLAVLLGLQFQWIDPANFVPHFLLMLPFVALGAVIARARISEEQLDQAEMLPIGGVCRVCFRPARSMTAVYCERHRP
jgi:hypothetical protein